MLGRLVNNVGAPEKRDADRPDRLEYAVLMLVFIAPGGSCALAFTPSTPVDNLAEASVGANGDHAHVISWKQEHPATVHAACVASVNQQLEQACHVIAGCRIET